MITLLSLLFTPSLRPLWLSQLVSYWPCEFQELSPRAEWKRFRAHTLDQETFRMRKESPLPSIEPAEGSPRGSAVGPHVGSGAAATGPPQLRALERQRCILLRVLEARSPKPTHQQRHWSFHGQILGAQKYLKNKSECQVHGLQCVNMRVNFKCQNHSAMVRGGLVKQQSRFIVKVFVFAFVMDIKIRRLWVKETIPLMWVGPVQSVEGLFFS